MKTEQEEVALGLTPKLKQMSATLRLLDENARVRQMLAMANYLPPLKDFYR